MQNVLHKRKELSRMLSSLDQLAPGDPFPIIPDGREIGKAYRIGITGPVGAGKSTLINRLTKEFRKRDLTVGIIAIDPSSPITGGAVLGDRIRMNELTLDEGVFIRSLATKGQFGGLASIAFDAADLLDTYGFDRIIIETVGVGQNEVDIVEACDATVVVLEPGAGDDIQAIKAGLLEVADVFIVNKMDLKGSGRFMQDLISSLDLRNTKHVPKVFGVQGTSGEGIPELIDWLEEYNIEITGAGALFNNRDAQRTRRIRRSAESVLIKQMWQTLSDNELLEISTQKGTVRDIASIVVNRFLSNSKLES